MNNVFDTCTGCDVSFFRCSECLGVFSIGEKVYCVNKGEEHLCTECYEDKHTK